MIQGERAMNFPKVLLIAGWVALSAPAALAADQPMAGKSSSGGASPAADKNAIASVMSAAPKKVGAAATIVAIGTDGKMRTLRKGTNGFTCMPDNPTTPGPDPMCMDKAALEWADPG